jgi:hypothetical protein
MQANRPPQPAARALEAQAVVPGTLDLSTLEERCIREIESGCLADPTHARFSLELLRRATSQDSQQAWQAWQRCFGEILRSWLRCHPRAEEACRFDSEEHYLAQSFACFRQVIADHQQFECPQLSTALTYLRACLNGVLLDALRTNVRPKGTASREPAHSAVQPGGDYQDAQQLWECIQDLFPGGRERWMAYLLFHCHLSPSAIFCLAPHQFRDMQEIGHVRRQILEGIRLRL